MWRQPYNNRKLSLSRTEPKSEQLTFKCNICFNSTLRTSRSQWNHSQEPLNGLVMILPYLPYLTLPIQEFRRPEVRSSGSVHKIGANITIVSGLFGFRPCSGQGQFTLGRVNGQIRAEIQTSNFQLQNLLWLYSKNLIIVLEPFVGTLWMSWCWSWGSMSRIWADIAFESWLPKFWPCSRFSHLPYHRKWC